MHAISLRFLSLSLTLLAVAAPATAQRVVVVDAANGPGTDHTTLTAAFAGLLNGDVLVVRAGTYAGVAVTTPHSFVMLGEGSPVITPAPGAPANVASLDLTLTGGGGQRVALRSLTCQSQQSGQIALDIDGGVGVVQRPAVNIEQCTIESVSTFIQRRGLRARGVGLTIQACLLSSSTLEFCIASLVDSTVIGADQVSIPFNQFAEGALDMRGTTVWIVDSTLRCGSSNGFVNVPPSCLTFGDGSFFDGSTVHIAGNSLLVADPQPAPGMTGSFVLKHTSPFLPVLAAVTYESSVTLTPSPGQPIASGGIDLNVGPVRTLKASAAPLGGQWSCTARGVSGDVTALVVSTLADPQTVLGLSALLDPLALLVGEVGIVPANGTYAFLPLPVPAQSALLGTVVQGSAVSLLSDGSLAISNPVSGILH